MRRCSRGSRRGARGRPLTNVDDLGLAGGAGHRRPLLERMVEVPVAEQEAFRRGRLDEHPAPWRRAGPVRAAGRAEAARGVADTGRLLFGARGAGTAEELGALFDAWPAAQDEGDEWLRVGGVKLGVDGGFEGGWMREPYAGPFGRGGTFHGLQTMPADRFTMAVTELNRRGWPVATHAVGDAAIDQVLAGYEAADVVRSIEDRSCTIEHGFIAADQLARIRELGLVLSAQHHLYVSGPRLAQY